MPTYFLYYPLIVIFDGDDCAIYRVDRSADEWVTQPGPSRSSADVSRMLRDCILAQTNFEGRVVELQKLGPNHKYAAYNRAIGKIVGPPRGGKVFVSVPANEKDRQRALREAKKRRRQWQAAVGPLSLSAAKRKRLSEGNDSLSDMFSATTVDGKLQLLLPVQARHVREPRRVPGTRFGNEYCALNDDTPEQVGKIFGCDSKVIVDLNKAYYPGLRATSRLQTGTLLALPAVAVADGGDDVGSGT